MTDEELGKGVYEDRILRVRVRAEVSYLRGLEYRNGREVNTYSETDPGWDDLFKEIDRKLKSRFSTRDVCGMVEINAEEWE